MTSSVPTDQTTVPVVPTPAPIPIAAPVQASTPAIAPISPLAQSLASGAPPPSSPPPNAAGLAAQSAIQQNAGQMAGNYNQAIASVPLTGSSFTPGIDATQTQTQAAPAPAQQAPVYNSVSAATPTEQQMEAQDVANPLGTYGTQDNGFDQYTAGLNPALTLNNQYANEVNQIMLAGQTAASQAQAQAVGKNSPYYNALENPSVNNVRSNDQTYNSAGQQQQVLPYGGAYNAVAQAAQEAGTTVPPDLAAALQAMDAYAQAHSSLNYGASASGGGSTNFGGGDGGAGAGGASYDVGGGGGNQIIPAITQQAINDNSGPGQLFGDSANGGAGSGSGQEPITQDYNTTGLSYGGATPQIPVQSPTELNNAPNGSSQFLGGSPPETNTPWSPETPTEPSLPPLPAAQIQANPIGSMSGADAIIAQMYGSQNISDPTFDDPGVPTTGGTTTVPPGNYNLGELAPGMISDAQNAVSQGLSSLAGGINSIGGALTNAAQSAETLPQWSAPMAGVPTTTIPLTNWGAGQGDMAANIAAAMEGPAGNAGQVPTAAWWANASAPTEVSVSDSGLGDQINSTPQQDAYWKRLAQMMTGVP